MIGVYGGLVMLVSFKYNSIVGIGTLIQGLSFNRWLYEIKTDLPVSHFLISNKSLYDLMLCVVHLTQ